VGLDPGLIAERSARLVDLRGVTGDLKGPGLVRL
jgi:hypothetical protein